MFQSLMPVFQALFIVNLALISNKIRQMFVDHLYEVVKNLVQEINNNIDSNNRRYSLNTNKELQQKLIHINPNLIIKLGEYTNKSNIISKRIPQIPKTFFALAAIFCFYIMLLTGLFGESSPYPMFDSDVLLFPILVLGIWLIGVYASIKKIGASVSILLSIFVLILAFILAFFYTGEKHTHALLLILIGLFTPAIPALWILGYLIWNAFSIINPLRTRNDKILMIVKNNEKSIKEYKTHSTKIEKRRSESIKLLAELGVDDIEETSTNHYDDYSISSPPES